VDWQALDLVVQEQELLVAEERQAELADRGSNKH